MTEGTPMWTCAKCGEQLEDTFEECWKCGTFKDGTENLDFEKPATIAPQSEERHPIQCPRCEQALDYMGTKLFHEGTRWGALGDIGELFVNKEKFDVYCCPRCGRVEFFVDGIGEEFRPK
jgi:hypothetical protein